MFRSPTLGYAMRQRTPLPESGHTLRSTCAVDLEGLQQAFELQRRLGAVDRPLRPGDTVANHLRRSFVLLGRLVSAGVSRP